MVEILKNAGTHKILSIMAGLDGETPLQLIELAGRTAYQSQNRITDGSAERFTMMLRNKGHESVLEHSAMTVEFSLGSRGFTHEFVRHRLVSYTQESTRRVDESNFQVIIPPGKDADKKVVSLNLPNGQEIKVSFREWMDLNEQMYRGLKEDKWATEDARHVLPIGIKSQIVATCNFREWRLIFKLRCAFDAHWEIRRIMINLLRDAQKRIPVIFDDFHIIEDDKKGLSAVTAPFK